MYAEERQQAMAQLVSARGRLSVVTLASEFDVTTETIRRDLSALERLGLVRRVHGGAVPPNLLSAVEPTLRDRDQARAEVKEKIAAAALALLPPPGASVLVDAGSTTARLAALWPRELAVTVYTHAVPVASLLAAVPGVRLQLLPGRVRTTTQAAVGADTVEAIGRLSADVVFLGTNALAVEHGLSTPDADEAATKRALVRASRQVIVLADASKIGEESTVRFATLDEVDIVVTDASIEPEDHTRLVEAGVEVVVA